ncbi:hypothetical protein LTR86_001722 [Recurvomyces mirabilis]|nr:hypothetical protein LTR86_001722 [Recurvomyces mirabilis]
MQPSILLSTAFLVVPTIAQSAPLNTSREYILWTCLKPNQTGKETYQGLQLSTYHTGAGESDIVFSELSDNYTVKGWLTPASNNTNDTNNYYQELDLGTPTYPWTMLLATNVNFYAAWEPVRVFVGSGSNSSEYGVQNGFFINETGLQWTSAPHGAGGAADYFGGWLVCDWWHEVPQLFVRNRYYNSNPPYTPSSCADVDLVPYYY